MIHAIALERANLAKGPRERYDPYNGIGEGQSIQGPTSRYDPCQSIGQGQSSQGPTSRYDPCQSIGQGQYSQGPTSLIRLDLRYIGDLTQKSGHVIAQLVRG